jgi:hypothetical protein
MMNQEQKEKLTNLIQTRQSKIREITEFKGRFKDFMKSTIRQAVHEINDELSNGIGDRFKVFYDDPFEFSNTKYFVLLQLYLRFEDEMNFFDLDIKSKQSNPAIKFEGKESAAKVVVSQRLFDQKDFKKVDTIRLSDLDKDKVTELLLEFLSALYNQ